MHFAARSVLAALLAFFGVVLPTHASDDPYPDRAVRIEELKLESSRTPLKLPRRITQKTKDFRTVVAVGHVSKSGAVIRSKLEQSSGVEQFDRTAVRWMLSLKFAPFLVDGEPTEVSLILPMRIPADDALR